MKYQAANRMKTASVEIKLVSDLIGCDGFIFRHLETKTTITEKLVIELKISRGGFRCV